MTAKTWQHEFEGLRAEFNFVWFVALQVYASLGTGFLYGILQLLSYYFLILYLKGKIRYVLWNFGKKKIINNKAVSEK